MNPTIFEIKTLSAKFWLMQQGKTKQDQEMTKTLIANTAERGVTLYGSFYRPGELFDEPVFVCPKCVHASCVSWYSDDDEYEEPFHCKYCGTDWETKEGEGLVAADFASEYNDEGELV